MEEYIGIIKLFGGNFAPQNWAFCNGQLMSISQNSALFSILGTTYGGDGQTTFALPDLRSRVPIGMGQGPGLSAYQEGQVGGSENNTLLINNLPPHNHGVNVNSAEATIGTPTAGASLAAPGAMSGRSFNATLGYNTATPNVALNTASTSPTGSGIPVNNLQPYMAMNYIICLYGIYPPRS